MIPLYGVPKSVDALALVRRLAEQDKPVPRRIRMAAPNR